MKVFLKYFAIPILIGVVAGLLYIVDALIGGLFVSGGSFMWVAFVFWTVFYSSSVSDRIRGLIGAVVGFLCGVVMMLITNSFTANIGNVSISCLLGVLIVNFLVMFMDKGKKIWLNSLSGAFAGIFLTFSGLGVGLSPIASVNSAFLMLGIILVYGVLGLICGFVSTVYGNKINAKLKTLENEGLNGEDKAEIDNTKENV